MRIPSTAPLALLLFAACPPPIVEPIDSDPGSDTAIDTDTDTDTDTDSDTLVATAARLIAVDQQMDLSCIVLVDNARYDQDFYVVVLDEFEMVRGSLALTEGSHSDVIVEINPPATDAEELKLSLFVDENNDNVFAVDERLVLPNNSDSITINMSVPDGTPEALFTLEEAANGIRLGGFVPAARRAHFLGATANGDLNPTLRIPVGARVAMDWQGIGNLQLITRANLPADDTLLLSMGTPVGSYEFDGRVNWSDENVGRIAFTATALLMDDLTGYRDGSSIGNRRGIVTAPPNVEE